MALSSGSKSSEFLTTLMTIASIASGVVPEKYVPVVAALGGVYVACRTALKAVHAMGYANNVPDLPEITLKTESSNEK